MPVDAGQLRYGLDRDHLGLVAWGEEPERALVAIGDATGLALLTVAGTDTTAWGWLGALEIGSAERRAVRCLEPPTGIRIAIGERGQGPEGFRLTHRQAWNTYRIARDTSVVVAAQRMWKFWRRTFRESTPEVDVHARRMDAVRTSRVRGRGRGERVGEVVASRSRASGRRDVSTLGWREYGVLTRGRTSSTPTCRPGLLGAWRQV